ncbi:MAG: Ni/Fe hydrogenase subunit alpha [bacterium]|nr:Ni/Fe hydrogenase subunit alpha [bacterium]
MGDKIIEIKHLTRVEGHGGITVFLDGGKVRDVHMDIFEGGRFYEALVRGKPYHTLAPIVSRVCAICSASHAVCAQIAVEDAFGIEISPRTRLLRDLLLQGENIESHALHLFLLVLPDYLGYPSALDMARDHGHAARMGLALKQLGNLIQETVGGRAVHPPNVLVGGFGRMPSPSALENLVEKVRMGMEMIPILVELMAGIPVPRVLEEETVYLALLPPEGYGFVSRRIAASDGSTYSAEEFASICHERVVSHSHAKQSLYSKRPFAVGAQSRVVLAGDRLEGQARVALDRFGGQQGPFGQGNPLFNGLAQAVELVYSLETAARNLQMLLDGAFPTEEKRPEIVPRSGTGIGLIEAPRGILYHQYEFDEEGTIVDADIITPTAQNLSNIERDLRLITERYGSMIGRDGLLLPGMAPLNGKDLPFLLQVIARAYDPCISCSVH